MRSTLAQASAGWPARAAVPLSAAFHIALEAPCGPAPSTVAATRARLIPKPPPSGLAQFFSGVRGKHRRVCAGGCVVSPTAAAGLCGSAWRIHKAAHGSPPAAAAPAIRKTARPTTGPIQSPRHHSTSVAAAVRPRDDTGSSSPPRPPAQSVRGTLRRETARESPRRPAPFSSLPLRPLSLAA